MGVVDFSEYVKQIIQGGQAIEGNVVRIIADNGDDIGEAVFKVIQGGNGTAANVGVSVTSVGGAATTTGVAFLALDIGLVGAAIAPALGVLAGTGLYNLSPEFWSEVSDALVNAGQTVGGKVIAYWNGDNVYFDEDTIEIFKQKMVNAGVFDPGEMQEMVTEDETPITIAGSLFKTENAVFSGTVNGNHVVSTMKFSEPVFVVWSGNSFGVITASENANHALEVEISQSNGTTRTMTLYTGNVESYYGKQYSSSSSTFQWYYPTSTDMELLYVSGASDAIVTPSGVPTLGYLYLYGTQTESEYNLQDDAVYPDDNPFPLIYPRWLPWEYPIQDPSGLPDIYPIKYPGVLPDPYPTQEPAQEPNPESPPEIIPVIEPGFELPDPGSTPTPEPEPDPDPQPEPEPIEPNPDPIVDPDPPEPNPDPTPTPIIPPAPLPSTVSSNKLFTVYNPTSSQLDSLGGYLWDASLIATLRDIWQDPLDGIISLIQVYATPDISGSHNIILGYLDTGISSAVVGNQFVTVDCGSVQIKEDKKNATDYAPYTSIHLYLPFIGIVELDANECMNSTMSIKYRVDMYTGTCLALVSITRTEDMPNSPILYTYNGNCAQQLPLTSGNATGVLTALIGAIGSALTAGSGGGLTMAAGVSIAGQSLSHEMMHVNHSGNISANAGIMGNKKPYVIIGRRHGYDATNYNKYYGFPANKTVTLGNHTGYAKVKKCWLKTSATQAEYESIMELLADGVFL